MYKEPKDTAKTIEAGEMFGIGEFLLVRYLRSNIHFLKISLI
jgi:hypothetical protein